MQNLLKSNFFYQEIKEKSVFCYEKASPFNSKIHSPRESPDSSGSFGFKRTGKTN